MAGQPSGLYQLNRDLTREQLIEALAAVPAQLREVLAGQISEGLTRKSAVDDWSAIETLRHIRDACRFTACASSG